MRHRPHIPQPPCIVPTTEYLHGDAFEKDLSLSCSSLNIVLHSFAYSTLDADSVNLAVRNLDKRGIGVVGIVSFSAADLRLITEAAMAREMIGQGIPACWWFVEEVQLTEIQALPQSAQQALHGSHFLNGYGGGSDDNPRWR